MIILIIILIAIIIGLIAKIYNKDKETQHMIEAIDEILLDKTNTTIKTLSYEKSNDDLVMTINQLIVKYNELQADYRRAESNHKEMTTSIAHDFRTPLTSMLGYVQILGNIEDKETQNRYVSIIEQRIQFLSELIDTFYTMSLLESNEYPTHFQTVNPVVLLQEQLASYYEDLSQKFETISINLDENIPNIISDPQILNRIFGNLIKNSLTHGLGNFSLSSFVENEKITFVFSNEIPLNSNIDSSKLFDRNYSSAKNSSQSISSGLGLSLSNQLASIINGTLSAEIYNNEIIKIKLVLN